MTAEKQIEGAKGRIDIELAEKFLSDHVDSHTGKVDPDERSLCGHIDLEARGVPEWDMGSYNPFGAVTGKLADSELAERCPWWPIRVIGVARIFGLSPF